MRSRAHCAEFGIVAPVGRRGIEELLKREHMAAATNSANVKISLANSEPSHTWHLADMAQCPADVRFWG